MNILHDLSISRRPLAAFVLIGVAWGCFAALVPPVKAQIGASDALYGSLVLIPAIGAVASMWLAPLAQGIFARWAMPLAGALVGIGFVIVGHMTGPISFVAALLVVTAGTGIVDVLCNAELSEREAHTGRALMNLNHALYSFAFASGAIGGGVLREAGLSPAAITFILAVIIMGLCGFMHTPRREPTRQTAEEPAHHPALPVGLILIGGSVVLAAFLTEAATEGWSAWPLERTLGGDPGHGALGPALFGLTMGFGRLSGHWLASRVHDITLIGVACVMASAGLVLAGLAPTLAVAYIGFACAGLGVSVVVPLCFALIGRSVTEELRLVAIARAAAMGYAAFFLGPPMMGFVAALFGLRMSFIVLALFLLTVAAVLVPALSRQVRAAEGPR